ncbi:MAG: hypothetical protein WAO04_13880, partial [Candidatus Sulfotelmatobacter sp.]
MEPFTGGVVDGGALAAAGFSGGPVPAGVVEAGVVEAGVVEAEAVETGAPAADPELGLAGAFVDFSRVRRGGASSSPLFSPTGT